MLHTFEHISFDNSSISINAKKSFNSLTLQIRDAEIGYITIKRKFDIFWEKAQKDLYQHVKTGDIIAVQYPTNNIFYKYNGGDCWSLTTRDITPTERQLQLGELFYTIQMRRSVLNKRIKKYQTYLGYLLHIYLADTFFSNKNFNMQQVFKINSRTYMYCFHKTPKLVCDLSMKEI